MMAAGLEVKAYAQAINTAQAVSWQPPRLLFPSPWESATFAKWRWIAKRLAVNFSTPAKWGVGFSKSQYRQRVGKISLRRSLSIPQT
jgi:hypothetical protein